MLALLTQKPALIWHTRSQPHGDPISPRFLTSLAL
jgi:hypothetical protein